MSEQVHLGSKLCQDKGLAQVTFLVGEGNKGPNYETLSHNSVPAAVLWQHHYALTVLCLGEEGRTPTVCLYTVPAAMQPCAWAGALRSTVTQMINNSASRGEFVAGSQEWLLVMVPSFFPGVLCAAT